VSSIERMATVTSRSVAPCFSANRSRISRMSPFCLGAVLFELGEALYGIYPAFETPCPTGREVELIRVSVSQMYDACNRRAIRSQSARETTQNSGFGALLGQQPPHLNGPPCGVAAGRAHTSRFKGLADLDQRRHSGPLNISDYGAHGRVGVG